MTDRLTSSELQQIASHRQSCDCDLCTRHRLLAMAELQFGQEFEARLEALQAQPRVLMLAGSLRDADTFVCQYQRQYPDAIFRYPRSPDDLRGLHPDSTTLVRVGRWGDNPLVRNFASELDSAFPGWRSSQEYLWDDYQNAWLRVLYLDPVAQEQLQQEVREAAQEAIRETLEYELQILEVIDQAGQVRETFEILEHELQILEVIDQAGQPLTPTQFRRFQPPGHHSCVTCCYLLRGNPDICNAFHTPGNLYAANECADWEQR